jgi:hypothetical protein
MILPLLRGSPEIRGAPRSFIGRPLTFPRESFYPPIIDIALSPNTPNTIAVSSAVSTK